MNRGRCDSSSFGSSDSDDFKSIKRRRKKLTKKKCPPPPPKPCKPVKKSLWCPCFNVSKRARLVLHRMRCGLPVFTALNTRCVLVYGVTVTLAAILFVYGGTVLRMLGQQLRISSLFMSTNDIVDKALAKYSADKLGLADYALESAGGSVLCSSDTFFSRSGALYSIFGVPLWYHSSTPREVIQPDVQPGKCWAMDGDKGYVMVKLSMPVVVTSVSLEHIPAHISPTGRIDSAPKDFIIVGRESSMTSPEVVLGTFVYTTQIGNAIQSYEIKDPYCTRQTNNYSECGPNQQVFRIIELRILSNHGNKDYTCIYRLRVHGKPLVKIPGRDIGQEVIDAP